MRSAPAFHPLRGDDALTRYPFLAPGQPLRDAAEWRGALVGKALPGGTVTAAAFAELVDDLVARLAAMPHVDGLWYDIHGAMAVEGMDDAEAVLLARIREVLGPDVVVSTSMDLHGNVSRELAHLSDLITCYRMAPHEDYLDTRSAPSATCWTCCAPVRRGRSRRGCRCRCCWPASRPPPVSNPRRASTRRSRRSRRRPG